MTPLARALRHHAALLSAEALTRARGPLRDLDPEQRRAFEDLAWRIAAGTARCLLEEAGEDERLARVLAEVYRPEETRSRGPAAVRRSGFAAANHHRHDESRSRSA